MQAALDVKNERADVEQLIWAAVLEVFEVTALLEVERSSMTWGLKNQLLDVSAVLPLSGQTPGLIVVSLEKSLAELLLESMLGGDDDGDVGLTDVVSELGNVIGGSAKSMLSGAPCSMGVPVALCGPSTLSFGEHEGLLFEGMAGEHSFRIAAWLP